MTIENTRDLRFWYSYLRMQNDLPLINEALVKEVKQKIRTYTNAPGDETRYLDEDFDGVTLLFPLPEDLKSTEAAVEYFREALYIHFVPSPYDCTGRPFTSWFKVFKRGNRFWAYHRIGRDA